MRKILFYIFISFSSAVLAFGAAPLQKQQPTTLSLAQKTPGSEVELSVQQPTQLVPDTVEKREYRFCPAADKLVKQNQIWSAPGGWKSHSASFVKSIDTFVGAQWIGVNLGKILCLYRGPKATTFMVSIERDNLMHAPSTGRWDKDLGGYRICHSTSPADCPFGALAPKKEEDLYEVIRGLKK